jgi:small subunit ribosomal protein S13
MAEDRPARPTQNIIRLAETNIDGNKPVRTALTRVKGVGDMFSNAICKVTGLGERKLADLSDGEIKNLEDVITNPGKHGIPSWLFNRKSDPITGQTRHISVSNLDFTQKMDVDREKRMKSYRGLRHIQHLPVRGQRTRGSFRKGKTMGVSKKKKG